MTPRLVSLFLALSLAARAADAGGAPSPAAANAKTTPPAAPANGPAAATPKASAPAAKTAAAATPAAPRNDSAIAPSATFDAFRLIVDRNIFNPNRSGRSSRSADEAPAVRTDTIAFVGTMDYDKGVFAIFDGSEAGFRKKLRAGDSVGPFAIKRVTSDSVDLEREGQASTLKIGQQLRRPEGGEWSVSGIDLSRPDATSSRSGYLGRPAADPSAAPAIPSDASDTLRRLMEQRQKQLKQ
jgi:hypothetical protein